MDKNTLLIIRNLDFNQIMLKLLTPNDADRVFPEQVVFKTILLVSLTTGIELSKLIPLKWNAIFKFNSKGGAVCLENFILDRKYNFPIDEKIKTQLSNFYTFLNQPAFDTKIVDSFKSPKTFNNWLLATNIALGIQKIDELDKEDWSVYRNKNLTQIIFGRRVVETCGYSNATSKFLKGIFKMETNEQLFSFLGYDTISEVEYNLSNLSIIENINRRYSFGEPKSFLDDDKHFYVSPKDSKKHYPFQHFQVFYDFLHSIKLNKYDIKTQSILLLLMLSLTNGIRPSSLLRLKWSDIFSSGKNGVFDCFIINNRIKFERFEITLDENTMSKILIHFKLLMGEDSLSVKRDLDRLIFLNGKSKNLNTNCFITNRMNPLTQPSLLREIKNTLKVTGFQHAEKFTTKSTQIMYGRRVIELNGLDSPSIRALKNHFNIRKQRDLFDFLFISIPKGKGNILPEIKEFGSIFEHILYDI